MQETATCNIFYDGISFQHLATVLISVLTLCRSGGSVGIATELRAGRSGIESRWGRDFPPVQTGPGAHPASCKMGTGSFPGAKRSRGVLLTSHRLLVPRSRKSRAISLPTLWATPGLFRDHFILFKLCYGPGLNFCVPLCIQIQSRSKINHF